MKKLLLLLPTLLLLAGFQNAAVDEDAALGMFLDHFREAAKQEIDLNEVKFAGGAGELTMKLVREARHLVQDTSVKSIGPLYPAQKHLLYVYGGKNLRRRTRSVDGSCREYLNGLDCSGFMRQLFLGSGITSFPVRAANDIRNPALLSKFLNGRYHARDLKNIPMERFQTGDIIYFKKNAGAGTADHVGLIVVDKNSNMTMFHSSGWRGACTFDVSDRAGPRAIHLDRSLSQHWYGIVRISE